MSERDPGSESDTVKARLEREARFHDDAFANDVRQVADKYYQATRESGERYRRLVLEVAGNANVLEYGCGTGSLALDILRLGGRVTGIDISPGAIEAARRAASSSGERAQFLVMNAENLQFADQSFDVICGSGILHHLDLAKAYSEIRRVLRRGGQAFFFEPLGHNIVINLYRRLTPRLRTPDEHPLLKSDIDLARHYFESVDAEYYHVFRIAGAWLPPWLERIYRPVATGIDNVLTHDRSPFKYQAWMSVLRFS
jgi:ubiquinone/menaquinone biosynthesis C-methylase UbiE